MNTIVYESEEEYRSMCNEFRTEIRDLIREYHIDYWTFPEFGEVSAEHFPTSLPSPHFEGLSDASLRGPENFETEGHFGLPYSGNLCEILHKTLMKLTKNQNEKWVDNITNILYLGIRGLAQSISSIQCDDTRNSFCKRELCNIMIVHMTNTILFDLVDAKGETVDGCENIGYLTHVVHIPCKLCSNLYIISHGVKNTCFNCYVI